MADEQITCDDCGNDFTFTEGEQEFYREKEFSRPKRCKPCRDKRKEAKGDGDRKTRRDH